jgi:hypothetical protein
MAVNDQVPNTLSEKLLNEEVRKMISNIENLNRMWKTVDTCYQRPKKYISEVLQSVTNSEKNQDVRQHGYQRILLPAKSCHQRGQSRGSPETAHEQANSPGIIGKMPVADWKQWAVNMPPG